jgi:hypothetical protein
MLNVNSIRVLCLDLIFHLSFLDFLTLFFVFTCRNSCWTKKRICRLLIYLKQSITFGYNNLARGVLAFLLQRLTIMCKHSSSFPCIMPSYKEVHMGSIWTRMNCACVGQLVWGPYQNSCCNCQVHFKL